MKEIAIETYPINLSKIKSLEAEEDRSVNTIDLVEICLDQIPQGGFTPKEIRDRNRIQVILDAARKLPSAEVFNLEDSDFSNLKKIIGESRWATRDKWLQKFLDYFENLK